jgi:hypothetical protein
VPPGTSNTGGTLRLALYGRNFLRPHCGTSNNGGTPRLAPPLPYFFTPYLARIALF